MANEEKPNIAEATIPTPTGRIVAPFVHTATLVVGVHLFFVFRWPDEAIRHTVSIFLRSCFYPAISVAACVATAIGIGWLLRRASHKRRDSARWFARTWAIWVMVLYPAAMWFFVFSPLYVYYYIGQVVFFASLLGPVGHNLTLCSLALLFVVGAIDVWRLRPGRPRQHGSTTARV